MSNSVNKSLIRINQVDYKYTKCYRLNARYANKTPTTIINHFVIKWIFLIYTKPVSNNNQLQIDQLSKTQLRVTIENSYRY